MTPNELHRRWRRRFDTLEESIRRLFAECRNTGGAESIHDLRVAIRRARLYAQVGRPLLRKGTAKRFDAWARRINKLLGPIRDCDVCMNWLAGSADTMEAIQSIHEERVRLWCQAVPRLKRPKSNVSARMVVRTNGKAHVQKLNTRFRKELHRTAEGVMEAVSRVDQMSPQELHDLRRGLRRWRYLRELSLAKRVQTSDSALAWLIEVQNALGESQNLEMAVALLDMHPEWTQRDRLVRRARQVQTRWIARARQRLRRMPRELD